MPARLGAATILLSIISAFLSRADGVSLGLMVGVVLAFIIAGFITRFLNQPINAVVMTWTPDAPPANWMQLRDTWWYWHLVRLFFGITGLSLLTAAMLRRHTMGA
jgi:uncharacterized membrane protein